MRVKMDGAAPSWLCNLAQIGYHKSCMIVHPGSMFRVVYHAQKLTAYGTKVFILEEDPNEYLTLNNNKTLDLVPRRLFLGKPEAWSEIYDGVDFHAVIMNCDVDTAVFDIYAMWDHVKPQGRMVAVLPPEALCQNPKIKYTDEQYEIAELLGQWVDETWASIFNMPDSHFQGDGQPPQVFVATKGNGK